MAHNRKKHEKSGHPTPSQEPGRHSASVGVGTLGGAAVGAVVGSAAGPVGAVLGAVVGGVGGALGGKAVAEKIEPAQKLSNHANKNEEIAKRAYEKFLQRGSIHGHHERDWLEAEREVCESGVKTAQTSEPVAASTGGR